MAELICMVVTPEETVLSESTSFVTIPLYDGEIGIAPGHSPMIGRLGYGEMRLKKEDNTTARYYVEGGFVQVVDNVVSILTQRTILASQLDIPVVQEQLDEARRQPSHSPEFMENRDLAVQKARAQLRIANRA